MSRKSIVLSGVVILILYPLFTLWGAFSALNLVNEAQLVEDRILNFQIAIWITWILITVLAIYYKWTRKKDLIFYLTYAYILAAFTILAFLIVRFYSLYDLKGQVTDPLSFGIISVLPNIFTAAVLTGLLQIAVWWFTRRWHRK